jgi:odorant receptor
MAKVQDFLKFSQNCLKLLALDPIAVETKPQNRREKAVKACKAIYFVSFIINLLLGYLLMITYAIINRNDFVKSTIQLPSLVTAPTIVLNSYLLWTKRESVFKTVQKLNLVLETNSSLWEKLKLEYSYQRFRKVAKRLKLVLIGLIVVNAVGPFLHYISKNELKIPVRMWFPFNENSVEAFPFVYVWTMIPSTLISMVVCGCDLLLYGFLTIISTQFEILNKRFEKIDVKSKDLRKKLIVLIKEHEELMKISDKVQEIFSKSLSANFFASSLLICLSGFQLTYGAHGDSSHLLKYATFVVIAMLQIFTLCSYSQRLIDSSLSVAQGAFNMNWWEIRDFKVRILVQTVIMRSQRHTKLRALKFAQISLENFTLVSLIRDANEIIVLLIDYYSNRSYTHLTLISHCSKL